MIKVDRRLALAIAVGVVSLAAVLFWMRPTWAADRPAPAVHTARWVRVRVWEAGAVAPNVSVNVPISVVSVALKVAVRSGFLDQQLEQHADLGGSDDGLRVRIRGADIESIWDAIAAAEPTDLVSVRGEDGERVEVRIE